MLHRLFFYLFQGRLDVLTALDTEIVGIGRIKVVNVLGMVQPAQFTSVIERRILRMLRPPTRRATLSVLAMTVRSVALWTSPVLVELRMRMPGPLRRTLKSHKTLRTNEEKHLKLSRYNKMT